MDSNQALAKIGVFVLLGINVAAYYYFWPRPEEAVKTVAKAAVEEKGEVKLLPPNAPAPPAVAQAQPTENLPPPRMPEETRLLIPNPPAAAPKKDDDSRIFKLLEQIDKDRPPELPILPAAGSAKRETPAKIELVGPDAVAVAPPVTPRMPPGLWQLHSENSANRTQLTARLREDSSDRTISEFRILCDRIATNPQNATVQALGNVTFSGAGWKGTCETLTVSLHETKLVFEQKVTIGQDTLGKSQDSVLRGDRFVWELPGASDAKSTGVTQPLSR